MKDATSLARTGRFHAQVGEYHRFLNQLDDDELCETLCVSPTLSQMLP